MSIRVGESWQAANGHRRWVSMPLHDLILGMSLWILIAWPFLLAWRLFAITLRIAGLILIAAIAITYAAIKTRRRT